MELQQQFETAVANSKTLKEKPDNETLLKLYSLYKQATEGDCTPAQAPENAFDFVAKFKFEAWNKLAGTSPSDAMQQYVNLVTDLKAKQ
ncbi:MAG: acyl-CoA-binding protein [Chitinophagaceae bacterium]|jgi:diazepam-binding inhibitor (GABA receptor modulating acyl-CoA-binding protein)|nr:acyl-CoA-binding protein [Chitinophagaceae bacterium]MCE2973733.1 acyl-CoA-binding protein [Sediminibacterium sp.]MCA6467834.1 acyl-CoA-binding protein [Chitinophagaceae bacterium]MCA6469553.1 acyl-CoA-binding protein [Chitinophagaceae bacterium]MCA6474006.1 acyl-CoA-binding protein [Chitinophagaceae bacterium]